MMLDDLRLLLSHTPQQATRADYVAAVVDDNVLGKPTRKARELALRHLATLYALDPINPIFRALRRLWPLEEGAQPLLALAVALARDPLLRGTQSFVLSQSPGAAVTREAVEDFLRVSHPDRFSAASLKSFAQNIAGTWTAAGMLNGRVRKVRAKPQLHPESIALLLFLGYLEGRTGQRLFSSEWMALLDGSPDELEVLASSASHRGLLVFMNAGGVKEVRFPGYLTPEEEQIRQEASHVV
ncbi:hypothetical protein [Cupriavidus laharis]|nr:hypothetical protein [Cupriavidus laharis]